MIATTVDLRDIEDPRAFVAAHIPRSGVILNSEEREDLIAEGLLILCELARRYEPHRNGYAHEGSLAGYATAYLPKRLQDAYQANRHCLPTVVADGTREVVYFTSSSLQAEDAPQYTATMVALPSTRDGIEEALQRLPAEHAMGGRATDIMELYDKGCATDEIARELRMNRREVSATLRAIAGEVARGRDLEQAG